MSVRTTSGGSCSTAPRSAVDIAVGRRPPRRSVSPRAAAADPPARAGCPQPRQRGSPQANDTRRRSHASGSWRPLPLGQEQQGGLDALACLLRVREPQLHEDRVGVLLHGALGELQRLSDRPGCSCPLRSLPAPRARARSAALSAESVGLRASADTSSSTIFGSITDPPPCDRFDRVGQLANVAHALLRVDTRGRSTPTRAAQARTQRPRAVLSTTTPICG